MPTRICQVNLHSFFAHLIAFFRSFRFLEDNPFGLRFAGFLLLIGLHPIIQSGASPTKIEVLLNTF
jgi:hypothetical protein